MGDFDRLPKEIALSILNRIDDFKSLCQYTLVSKRFASLIFCIRSVSLSLPGIDIESKEAHSNVDHVFHSMNHSNGEEAISQLIQPSSIQQKLKIVTFLKNFVELESVYLEFACPRTPCTSPLLKWKAKLGRYEPMVESLVSILPTSMCKETEYAFDQDQEGHSDIFFFQTPPGIDGLLFPLTCCSEWLVIIFSLIKCHHSLCSVTCTDSHGHGTLVLKDEQIVEWRKRLLSEESSNVPNPRTVDMGWFYELHLPVAGYWVKDVFFVFFNFLTEPGADNDHELEDLVTWWYGGEEKVLGEVVREILSKHIDGIIWELHPWQCSSSPLK